MKKAVLIPDSFKGTLSSTDICGIMKEQIDAHFPGCQVVSIPVADGGEGSVDAFLTALGGEKVHLQSASYTFSVDFTPTTIDGVRVTYDIHGGKIECSLTAKQAGTVAPTVTATAADTEVKIISGEPSESRPDSDYASIKAAVTKYLTADTEANS